jgi:AraC-like DNA-binding protein
MRELWITQKNPAKLMSLLYDIFGQLAEEESELSLPLSSIIEYMGTHFNDPLLSNEILAEQAHISEVYFRKLFKESYGVTPHQYILELRIRHAKLLLSEQSATVTAISEACGFSSVYHFCRSFKQITGMTPREFEKNESING